MRISSSLAEKCAALTSLALLALGAPHAYSGAAGAPLRFVNVAGEVGLSPQVAHGGSQKNWIAEANGSGTAVLDYDNDGWMDILIVSGATMSDLREIVAGRTPSRSARRV